MYRDRVFGQHRIPSPNALVFIAAVALAAVALVAGGMRPASAAHLPDLVVENLTVESTDWLDGDTINFTYTVTNVGLVAGADSASGLYLSTNTTISTADVLLLEDLNTGTMSPGEMNPEGEPNFFVLNIDALGVSPGTYFLGAIADHGSIITEENESNNATNSLDVIQVTVTDDIPDLVVENLTVDSTDWLDGDTINFTYTVTNVGTGVGADSASGLYLSTNTVISTADVLLLEDLNTGTMSVGEMNPEGEPNFFVLDIGSLGLSPGTYFLGAIADHTFLITEINEGNNATNSIDVIQITVTDNVPDLVVENLTVDSTEWVDGDTINFTYTVTNVGTGVGADSASGLYLSTNTVISTADVLLLEDLNTGTMSVGEMNPEGEPNFFVLDIGSLGLSLGTYFLGAIADHSFLINEISEENNVTSSSEVIQIVIGLEPDALTVVSPPCGVYDSLMAGDPVLPGSGVPKTVQMTGTPCGVPAGASAVVVTVTSKVPSAVGNLRVSAAGMAPSGGVVNYTSNGLDQSNTVTVPLSDAGAIDVAANGGDSHVRVVVVGFYSPTGTLKYTGLEPCAAADSRTNVSSTPSGGFVGPFSAGPATPDVDVVGTFNVIGHNQGGGNTDCGVPEGVYGVVANIVSIGGTGGNGGVAAGAGGSSPTEPTVNFAPIGLNNAAVAYLPVDGAGNIDVDVVGAGTTHIRVVVLGYLSTMGDSYSPVNPCSAFDSRDALASDPDNVPVGVFAGKRVGGNSVTGPPPGSTTYNVTGAIPAAQGGSDDCGVPDGANAVLINLVGIQPAAVGNFRAYETGSTPTGGVLNFTVLTPPVNNANAVVVPLSALGDMDLFVNAPANSGNPTVHARGVILGYFN